MTSSNETPIRKNLFLRNLREGRVQAGLWCSLISADVVELLAMCKPDWLLFDMEHTGAGLAALIAADRAAAISDAPLLARVPKLDIADMKRVLDAGVQTVLIPQINSAAEATAAVSYARFPPDGVRGVAGATRAARFGHWKAHKKALQDEIAVIVQIETLGALDEVETIVATPGLSAIFIGPADLSASLGVMDQFDHPKVIDAIDHILAAANAAEMPVGIFASDAEAARHWTSKGVSFVSVGQDTSLLLQSAQAQLRSFRNT